ncbi:MAG: hypothetical protein ACLRWP_21185 [Bilophila wadsworthia]
MEKELKRIEDMGVRFVTGSRADADAFQRLRRESDAVIVATGGHIPACSRGPHEGLAGIDFLKAINKGENPVSAGMSSSSAAATLAWMPQPGPMRWARKRDLH